MRGDYFQKLKLSAWPAPLLIAALVLAAYLPAVNGGFIWDDDYYVSRNPQMRAPDGLIRIWSSSENPGQNYPLVYTAFWLEYRLWGLNTTGYHLVNIFLHIANSLLLGLLLTRLKIPGGWWAAALFAVHPVQAESVAWITELKNVQSGFFFLLTLFCYLNFEERARRRWYLAALAAFLLALLSKSAVCPLPLVLLLLYPLRGKKLTGRELKLTVPFFLLALLAGAFTWWYEVYHVGTRGGEYALSLPGRFIVAGRAVWFYLGKLFFPFKLTFMYPRWSINPARAGQYLGVAGLIILAAALRFFRKGWGRPALIGLGYFVIMLAPTLGFVSMYAYRYSYVADHYQYLAAIGIITLITAAAVRLKRLGRTGALRTAITICLAGIVAILTILTRQQARVYRKIDTLWLDTLAKNPHCWMAYTNLGILLAERGETEEAIKYYSRVDAIIPRAAARTQVYIGNALRIEGKRAAAAEHFKKALQLDPRHAEALVAWGVLLEEEGKDDEAFARFSEALKITPRSAPAHNNLGIILSRQGRYRPALEQYLQALKINPYFEKAQYNLANLLFSRGEMDAAAEHYTRALEINPELAEAHYNLGVILLRQGRREEATRHLEAAVRLKPSLAGKLGISTPGKGVKK